MAKRTFLELVNLILRRSNHDTVTTVASQTGKPQMVIDYFNDAQNILLSEADWYTLYTERIFQASQDVVIQVKDFSSMSGGTITVTFNSTSTTITEGVEFSAVTSNDATATAIGSALETALSTVSAIRDSATIVMSTAPQNNLGFTAISTSLASTVLTVELSVNGTYQVNSDFGRAISLTDVTNNNVLIESSVKNIDYADPDFSTTGTPTHYSLEGQLYRIYPAPTAGIVFLEKYWKTPTKLSTDSQTSDLPEICEAPMIKWVESEMAGYANNSLKEKSLLTKYVQLRDNAIESNNSLLDDIVVQNPLNVSGNFPLEPPRLPSNY